MKLTYLLPKFTREKLSELACNLPVFSKMDRCQLGT